LVQKMGDGMGALLTLHGQSGAQAVNEALTQSIAKTAEQHAETLRALQGMFEQMQQQNKDISAHLRALHERIYAL
jgi:hypothetical protein